MISFPRQLTALQPFWGEWYLDSLLGEGSYGKVYLIHKTDPFGQTYYAAMKWIRVPREENQTKVLVGQGFSKKQISESYDQYAAEINEEIKLLKKLSGNSHIVNCEDFLLHRRQEKDNPGWDVLIRMEKLTTLTEQCASPLTTGDVINMGIHICDAILSCLREGVVHRDIKPDNIFIAPNGNYKLGDFGVAKKLDDDSAVTMQGTKLYMAPELHNTGFADNVQVVDTCSLGLVMYKLLNRHRLPFEPVTDDIPTQKEISDAFSRRMKGETPIPAPLYGSETLKGIVVRACAHDPKQRFASPLEMKEALIAAKSAEDMDFVLPRASVREPRRDTPDEMISTWMLSPLPSDIFERTIPLPPPPKPSFRKHLPVLLLAMAAVLIFFCIGVFIGEDGHHPPKPSPKATTVNETVPTATQVVNTATPFVVTSTPFVPTATPFVPTATPFVPTATPFVPTATPFVPTATPVVLTAIPVPTLAAATAYQLGLKAYENADFDQAFAMFAQAAQSNHVEAQYYLGYMYRSGQGVQQDYMQAVEWYEKAANRGSSAAQSGLGYLYYNGLGVEQNYEQAVRWYKKAAKLGDTAAQCNLGYMYERGQGVRQDDVQALEWYEKAAQQGLAMAQYYLGYMYYQGRGTEQNYETALEWFQKAAQQGHAEAQYNLGCMYYHAQGAERDYETALEWFQKAADQGETEAEQAILVLKTKMSESTPTASPAARRRTLVATTSRQVGSVVKLGSYGGQYITWYVLSLTDSEAVLLSEYLIESRRFDTVTTEWKKSGLRKWLNQDFLTRAFTDEERSAILAVEGDKVRLPSVEQLQNKDPILTATGTYHASTHGLWIADNGNSTYFTMTPYSKSSLRQVREDGSFGMAKSTRTNVGIRPVIVVSRQWLETRQ